MEFIKCKKVKVKIKYKAKCECLQKIFSLFQAARKQTIKLVQYSKIAKSFYCNQMKYKNNKKINLSTITLRVFNNQTKEAFQIIRMEKTLYKININSPKYFKIVIQQKFKTKVNNMNATFRQLINFKNQTMKLSNIKV